MHADTRRYNAALAPADRKTCELLAKEIERALPDTENKVWHAHPVWFLDGNPIVGYSRLKDGVRLLFWSGQSFVERGSGRKGASRRPRRATRPSARSTRRSSGAGSPRRGTSNGTTRTSSAGRDVWCG